MKTEVVSLLSTPCYLTYTIITEVGSLLITPCYLTMYHDSSVRLSPHYNLLPNMNHDNSGRLSAHHILLPNMNHDNRGRLSAHHILLPNMYHDNRNRISGLLTLKKKHCTIRKTQKLESQDIQSNPALSVSPIVSHRTLDCYPQGLTPLSGPSVSITKPHLATQIS